MMETFELGFWWAYWTYVWILIIHNDVLKIHIKENEESTVNEGWIEEKLGSILIFLAEIKISLEQTLS